MSDQDTLDAYADGTLDSSKVNELENLMGTTLNGSYKIIDGQNTLVPGRPLSQALIDAYGKRNANKDLATTDFSEYLAVEEVHNLDKLAESLEEKQIASMEAKKLDPNATVITKADTRKEMLNVLKQEVDPETGFLPRDMIETRAFNELLFAADGQSVDLNSPAWRLLSPSLYSEIVNYNTVRGASNIPARVSAYFTEVGQDLGVVDRVGTDNQLLYQADRDFEGLAALAQGAVTTAVTEGRVLKSVQDRINKMLEPLKPGIFKFDAQALGAMNSISGILAIELKKAAKSLPEYGGNPKKYPNTQIAKDRKTADAMKQVLTEFRFFTDDLEIFLSGNVGPGGAVVGGRSNAAQKRSLFDLATEAKKEQ